MIKLMSFVICGSTLALSACTSIEPLRPDLAARSVPSRLDEIAYINALRDAFEFKQPGESGCYDGAELKYFRPTLEQGYPDHTKEQETGPVGQCVGFKNLNDTERDAAIAKYLEAGFGLTDLYCQRYFVIASESDRKRQFERNTGSTVDTLVNAVLGVSGAGQIALGVANAGFEAYDSTYQNIQDAFMVSPDLANVRKLVHAAQFDYRTRVTVAMPASYPEARSTIERYAGLCSFTGMKQLVNDSVSSQTQQLIDAGGQTAEDRDATTGDDTDTDTEDGGAVTEPLAEPSSAPGARIPLPAG